MLHVSLHLLGLSNFAYTLYADVYVINIPDEVSPTRKVMGGTLKYLTYWNLWVQERWNYEMWSYYLV
jgi:hypothetical protein